MAAVPAVVVVVVLAVAVAAVAAPEAGVEFRVEARVAGTGRLRLPEGKGAVQAELRWPRCGDPGSWSRRSDQGEVSRDVGKGVAVLRRGVSTVWVCGGQAGAGLTVPSQRPDPNS